MQKWHIIVASLSLAACGSAEPRSAQYFDANPDEAQNVADDCRQGSVTGEECANASLAIKVEEHRKRFERFRGK